MTFREYLERIGDEKASELFGITVRRAADWRRGYRSPRPAVAHDIIEKTHGVVSWEDIYPRDKRNVA